MMFNEHLVSEGFAMNELYLGDNLENLREMDDERVHLICLDPSFSNGRD